MVQFIKTYWKTLVFFALVGLIGGYLTGIYLLDSYPPDLRQQLLDELDAAGFSGFPPDILLGAVTAVQASGYGIFCGALGIFLGKKTGLWKDETSMEKKPLTVTVIASILGGLALILPDILFFGHYSQTIMESYAVKPTVPYMLAAVLYGGVIEEVMLRLFLMSLIAFALHKLLAGTLERPPVWILAVSNVITAILFAAGHLPATALLMELTPMILFRCFLLNGGAGLLFGWLYRKYGLRYAMIAHGGCHAVSKLIWILFI